MKSRRSLVFSAPRRVLIDIGQPADPGPGEVSVRAVCSAISAGTESLVYTGLFPEAIDTDATIAALGGRMRYPLKYGYAAVGEVTACGQGVDPAWIGRLVFAFNPHESCFTAPASAVQAVPPGIAPEEAVFLPNMETAVNFVMDGAPLIGERVLVLGQGIVGLLTTALLARFPLQTLVTFDQYALRRQASLETGAALSLDPAGIDPAQVVESFLNGGADLCYEITGRPEALDLAVGLTGFAGRVVIGSWYGRKRATVDLGGRFHRSRIRLIASQVSTLAPELSGRWSKERRFGVAWDMIRIVHPARFITHRFPLEQADAAYRLLDEDPAAALQILFTY